MDEKERQRRIFDFVFDSPDIPADIRQKFEKWLLEHEADLTTVGIMQELWDGHAATASVEESRRGLGRLHEAIRRRVRLAIRRRILRWTGVAAALALIFTGGYLTAMRVHRPVGEVILLTAKDNTGEFTLPDGTRVWLNGESRLSYPAEFSGREREVSLCGEAFFEVCRDTLRPFRVRMNSLQVEVLGTSFDAIGYAWASCDEVILKSGSVRVTHSSQARPVLLEPNEKLRLDRADNTLRVETVDAENYCRWFEPRLIFDSAPLGDILINLERRYHTEIAFPATIPADTRLSFTVYREPLENILEVMGTLLPIGYEIRDERVTVWDKRLCPKRP